MLGLAGKVALITGAKRIGALVAERLAGEGVLIAVGYRSSRADADALVAGLKQRTRACLVQGDVAIEADVGRMLRETVDTLGGLHFVINLASAFERVPLETLDGAAWDRSMAEARGAYLLAAHAARILRENLGPARGQIVLFTDWAAAGETPYRHYLPYLTAKAAIDFMTRAYALELAPHGIQVNAIAPGPTMKPAEMTGAQWAEVTRETPLRRESLPDEIAEMIATLLKSETITGETIRVDAGRHIAGMGV